MGASNLSSSRPAHRHTHGSGSGNSLTRWLDHSAIGLSGLCLVHCLAFPVIIALLPAMAPILPQQPWVHPAILATALPLAVFALWRGWRRHRDVRPGLLGVLGLLLMGAGLAMGEGRLMETVLTVIGGLLLASAHALNWRLDHDARFHTNPSTIGE
ncbi:MerC domain-containing protein (plasmid) [Polymorphobacter sp. PAMC 29334]|uniref:MerC domain-containing protein n=1 Tax=Polymorphobacter sp. PAMC 29334 TaxID=2862331 RepID=UPI001C66AC64|nr:MerC domain-containing protein [Polymorphobacter sp. PAMC 29334]QYE37269.1 MerC domain-containing protein [Polymorphobacter sp. PAMC 29334]